MEMKRGLGVLPGLYAVCRLGADEPLPAWATGTFCSITRTPDELSVICEQERVPAGARCEMGWRALRLLGVFGLGEVGVLLPIAEALRRAGVSMLPVATYDTDYVLVRAKALGAARTELEAAGYRVTEYEPD